jgi:hypothetical protein
MYAQFLHVAPIWLRFGYGARPHHYATPQD